MILMEKMKDKKQINLYTKKINNKISQRNTKHIGHCVHPTQAVRPAFSIRRQSRCNAQGNSQRGWRGVSRSADRQETRQGKIRLA